MVQNWFFLYYYYYCKYSSHIHSFWIWCLFWVEGSHIEKDFDLNLTLFLFSCTVLGCCSCSLTLYIPFYLLPFTPPLISLLSNTKWIHFAQTLAHHGSNNNVSTVKTLFCASLTIYPQNILLTILHYSSSHPSVSVFIPLSSPPYMSPSLSPM